MVVKCAVLNLTLAHLVHAGYVLRCKATKANSLKVAPLLPLLSTCFTHSLGLRGGPVQIIWIDCRDCLGLVNARL